MSGVNISDTTGEVYYSGDWQDIKEITRQLKIGEGKLSQVNEESVAYYQEMVDREIDQMCQELYYVPLTTYNQTQPDGTVVKIFPGNIRRLARYWTAGLMVQSEFQGIAQNASEQAISYLEDSKRELLKTILFNMRIYGQVYKSNVSRTYPPQFQPGKFPEPDF